MLHRPGLARPAAVGQGEDARAAADARAGAQPRTSADVNSGSWSNGLLTDGVGGRIRNNGSVATVES